MKNSVRKLLRVLLAVGVMVACFVVGFIFAALAIKDEIPDKTPFQFSWAEGRRGHGGRWKLDATRGGYKNFLLIKQLKPDFDGIHVPQMIASDSGFYYSKFYGKVPQFSVVSFSSYARLPDVPDVEDHGRIRVNFPLLKCGRVVQVDGAVMKGNVRTHDPEAGMMHAIDLKAEKGDWVVAAESGTVVYVESRYPDAGEYDMLDARKDNRVMMLHPNGNETVYGHLMKNSPVVHEGDWVKAGETIAKVGSSGFSKNPHLHFQVGGINMQGYHAFPLSFALGGKDVVPVVGAEYCSQNVK